MVSSVRDVVILGLGFRALVIAFFLYAGFGVAVVGTGVGAGFFLPKTRSQNPGFFGTGVADGTGAAFAMALRGLAVARLTGTALVGAVLTTASAFRASGFAAAAGAASAAGPGTSAMAAVRAIPMNGAKRKESIDAGSEIEGRHGF